MSNIWSVVITAVFTSFLTVISQLFIDKVRRANSYPVFKIYTRVNKNEKLQKNYFFYYFSEQLNMWVLILKFNFENNSINSGKIYNVKLLNKDNFHGNEIVNTSNTTQIIQDKKLYDFINGENFANSIFYQNALEFEPKDNKTVHFVFLLKNAYPSDDVSYTLFYRYSSKKAKTKKLKFTVPAGCVIKKRPNKNTK